MKAGSGRTVGRTAAGRCARAVVLDHTLRCTRGLPPRVAEDRFAEICSDLWEHAAACDAAGRTGSQFAVAVLIRWIHGVPSDITWRRAHLLASGSARSLLGPARPARRAWIPIAAHTPPFDQTNGTVSFDPGGLRTRSDDDATELFWRGAVIHSAGFAGGSC